MPEAHATTQIRSRVTATVENLAAPLLRRIRGRLMGVDLLSFLRLEIKIFHMMNLAF